MLLPPLLLTVAKSLKETPMLYFFRSQKSTCWVSPIFSWFKEEILKMRKSPATSEPPATSDPTLATNLDQLVVPSFQNEPDILAWNLWGFFGRKAQTLHHDPGGPYIETKRQKQKGRRGCWDCFHLARTESALVGTNTDNPWPHAAT